jgi:hypothetical protein
MFLAIYQVRNLANILYFGFPKVNYEENLYMLGPTQWKWWNGNRWNYTVVEHISGNMLDIQ